MNFAEATQYLLSLGHETLAIKLGLRNTELLLARLGNPQTNFESVQIAGTNGKGSTAVVLDSICRAAGINTGLYTSPHLVSIRERIKINGEEISEDDFALFASQVRTSADDLVASGELEALPTFFEHVTAIALLAFREAKVSLAILETGLGGRLDATTVARAETVAITPVSFDHVEQLGNTLKKIAFEKAAIIRPGVTAIIAKQPKQVLEVITERSVASHVQPLVNGFQTTVEGATRDGRFRCTFQTDEDRYECVLLGLRGRHQIQNAGLAIALAESLRHRGFKIPRQAVIEGVETAQYPGRLQLREGAPSVLIDGAHNLSGARALRDYLRHFVNTGITMVFGSMRDKNISGVAAALFPLATRLILTRIDNPRAMNQDTIGRFLPRHLNRGNTFRARSTREALDVAKQKTPAEEFICVTGSLYLAGEVIEILRLKH